MRLFWLPFSNQIGWLAGLFTLGYLCPTADDDDAMEVKSSESVIRWACSIRSTTYQVDEPMPMYICTILDKKLGEWRIGRSARKNDWGFGPANQITYSCHSTELSNSTAPLFSPPFFLFFLFPLHHIKRRKTRNLQHS